MKRRQFLQSIAAAAGTPLMPAGLLGTSAVSAEHYARAVAYVASDACFAPTNLLSTLGLNGETGRAVMAQLKIDGLIGEMGNTGLMYSKTMYAKQAKIAAAALRELSAANTTGKPSDIIRKAQHQFQKLTAAPDTPKTNDLQVSEQFEQMASDNQPSETKTADSAETVNEKDAVKIQP
jgi:hypothetical protein